ncbi:MAG: glycosyltransferase family 39 protein [Saprospiraceae bacterium]|nr:glycosyltransferase family 39 protein [Saprospiraceae bacterium]MBK7811046.1 glycosyltransferase family 39 protein [Saprospiraceae bacterium]MBK9630649.1 glycosyltransferase family 39 protein [Saprospiraceae bacterium]
MMNSIFSKFWTNKYAHLLIIGLLSFLLYVNTLGNKFVLDDFIVIKNNDFTTKGVAGIPDILKYDTFRGFLKNDASASAVTGGRYRPMTLVFFAVVWEIFPDNPMVFHLLNAIIYVLLCLFIYLFLVKLLELKFPDIARPVSFLSAFIFAIHPIHTEVVANIKGLDEIFALLFSVLSFYFILKAVDQAKVKFYIWALIMFTLAMFSKESAVSFLALIPLGLLFFRSTNILSSVKAVWPAVIGFVFYIAARVAVIGFTLFEKGPNDLMVNPFLKYKGLELVEATTSEKLGMIFYSLLKYIGLLIFPHPLTHDYFPKHIPLVKLITPIPFLSLLVYVVIVYFIFRFWNRNKILTYSLILFLLPTILISNLIFAIGTPMGERFIFISSLGACLLFGYLLYRGLQSPHLGKLTMGFSCVVFALFSFKTVTRNQNWKDNYTLFSTDVKVSHNSAKAQSSLGFDRMSKYRDTRDTNAAKIILDEAILHLEKTVAINPREISCYHYLGNAYYMKRNYLKASEYYSKYMDFQPNNYDVIKNLATAYREEGRAMAMKQKDLEQALDYLFRSLKLNQNDPRTVESIGIAYGALEDFDQALNYLHKAADMAPRDAYIVVNLANTYYKKGDRMTATELMKKAYLIDPNLGNKLSQTQKEFF